MVDTINLRTNKPTIFFDIETGGFWANREQSIRGQRSLGVKEPQPKVSSVLSISYKMGEDSATFYSKPVKGSWVSQFSQENILPQLQNKTTITEEDSIRNFINVLRQNPEANLAGYNIRGFDIDFLRARAQQYGLGSAFSAALRGRVIEDTAYLIRDIMMESISSHLYKGTFSEELGGKTFAQAELEYFGPGGRQKNRRRPRVPYEEQPLSFRMLSQAEAYVKGGFRGRVAGWKLGDTFSAYSKWANLPEEQRALATAAHESLADVKMTEILHEAVRSGKFQQFVETEEFAKSWLESVKSHRAAGAADKTAGRFWSLEQSTTGRITPQRIADSVSSATASLGRKIEDAFYLPKDPMPRSARKWAIIMGASAAALWAGAGYLAFSGSDDEYNVIEGLRHDGIASEFRREITEFGSGWKGTKVQIDPEILEFREKVWDDREKRAELLAELKLRQDEAQADIDSFRISDLFEADTSTIRGINQRQKVLRAVRLENFIVTAEDADSLTLRRKGFFNRLFGNDILIRLAGIDAPETSAHGIDPLDFIRKWQSQVGGEEATERLQNLIDTEELSLFVKTEGQSYGRYMGVLAGPDGDNINLRLIEEGLVSALPFGKASEDLVRRSDTLDAERRAKSLNLGIHQYARYKAIEATNSILGSDITYNTLTRIDKLAQNLNLGAYGSWLESLGSEKRELTAEEIGLARKFGYSLRSQYGRRFSGRDDSYNTIEGLGHSGIAHQMRRQLTEFGSGWLGYGAPIALGLATALVSGDLSMGLSAGGGATAGASIGYLYGGTKGAIAGIFAGGAILGGLDYGAEQAIGGIAGAAVAGLSLSVGTSLKSVGNMKGGLLYDTNKALVMRLAKTSNVPENQIGEFLKFQYGHNPLTDAAGFSSTTSRAVLAQINAARSFTLGKEGSLFAGINKVMDLGESVFNNKHFSSIIDATLGSPRLQSLAREYGAINLVPPRDIAKAVGIDVLEGLPMALAAGGLSYVFGKRESAEQSRYSLSEINARTLDTKNLTPEQFKMLTTSIAPVFGRYDKYNTLEGLGHGGMAGMMRQRHTDFSSPVNLVKATKRASDLMSTFRNKIGSLAGILGRTFKTGLVAAKENVNEVNKIMKHHILPGAKRGQPLELSFLGLTAYEIGSTSLQVLGGNVTAVGLAITGASLAGSKFAYMAIKSRKQLAEATSLAVQFPKETKTGVTLGLKLFRKNLKGYILHGEKNLVGTFIDAGGGQKGREALKHKFGNAFSGMDDHYNIIEGLFHGGMSEQIRKQLTPFGSGWDALRNLTKVGEKFEDMLKSNEFKQALSGAKKVAQFGEGGFGAAYKMTGTFRGQEFSFIRKIGVIGEHEASIMRRFQDSFSPTVYSDPKFVRRGEGPLGRNTDYYSIDMELFEGQEFKHLLKEGTLPESAVHKYEAALKQMHEAGLVHGDAHAGNVFLTKEGNVGLIDFGLSGPEGKEFGSLSQEAIKQLEVVKPGGAVGKELDRRQLGHHIPEEGWGFFTERDKRLDLVAMDVMREKAGMALDPGSKTNAMRVQPARASAKSKAAVLENSVVSEKLLNSSSGVFAELQSSHVSSVFTNTPPDRGTYGVFTNTPPASRAQSKLLQSSLQQQANRQLTVAARGGKNSRM